MRSGRQKLLLWHGVLLLALGTILLLGVVAGHLAQRGPFRFTFQQPLLAIGFLEAYGLAAFFGVGLILGSRSAVTAPWHGLAFLLHAFLIVINLSFWDLYGPLGMLAMGTVSTTMHILLAGGEGYALAIAFARAS